jgi:Domain of unknown function (DUF4328)
VAYGGPGWGGPAYVARPLRIYRPPRTTAIVAVCLIVAGMAGSIVQCVLVWMQYGDLKRIIYGLSSEAEVDRWAQTLEASAHVYDLSGWVLFAAGIGFLVWLWRARENAEALNPASPHRHESGWVIGSWICPVVQFWYPLQILEDVEQASHPPARPGMIEHRPGPALRHGWWAAWVGYWSVLIAGSIAALVVGIAGLVRLARQLEREADPDVYQAQEFLIGLIRSIAIGSTVATGLLLVAGALMSLIIWRITRAQTDLAASLPTTRPPLWTPPPPPGFPTYVDPPRPG